MIEEPKPTAAVTPPTAAVTTDAATIAFRMAPSLGRRAAGPPRHFLNAVDVDLRQVLFEAVKQIDLSDVTHLRRQGRPGAEQES